MVRRVLLNISVPCEAQAVGTPPPSRSRVGLGHSIGLNQHKWMTCWGRSSERKLQTMKFTSMHGDRLTNDAHNRNCKCESN